MKVAIIGSFWFGSLEESYAYAFEQLGHTVARIDFEEEYRTVLPIQNKLVEKGGRTWWARIATLKTASLAIDARPDVILIIKGKLFDPVGIRELKKRLPKTKVINFNPDSPWEQANSSKQLSQSIPLYDIHFTWNRSLIQQFKNAGAANCYYLPFAYDPRLHFPVEPLPDNREYDLSFIGTYAPEREQLLTQLNGLNISVWGNGWEKATQLSKYKIMGNAIYGKDAVCEMNKGICSLNILRPQNEGSHNMRTFEIPATKNILLTTRSEEQSEFYIEAVDFFSYDSIEDIYNIINVLKTNEALQREIREHCYETVRPHTYIKRAETMLEMIFDR